MAFIPHTDDDIREMLATLEVESISELFDEIPADLRVGRLEGVPPALNEMQISRLMEERARRDGRLMNFIGAGAYEHHIPAPVWEIATRGEFYSAYTPYQAEASQGTLQLIYEYQSMMAALTDMDASNASLYDGASAMAEACLMAVRANRKSSSRRILVPATVNPLYRQVTSAIASNQALQFDLLGFAPEEGTTAEAALARYAEEDITAVVIQQPNVFGVLENVDALTDWAHERNALVIAVVNPISLGLLRPPGQWGARGADIVCGEGQPLGVPLSSGGPYFGFMACRDNHVRQLPGRLVGRTVDLDGNPGFVLTLQAREQHIRRSKATSNICTNQGLMVTAATIYMSLLGARGLERVAASCNHNLSALLDAATEVDGVRKRFNGDHFHEAVLELDRPVAGVLANLLKQDILGGYDLSETYPELGNALLVCATETKTVSDIEHYVKALKAALARAHVA